ncbi:MAG: fused MFS/spermidine synthase [Myxococcota bacterium]|nr:fused MFS/spermidine synthase [Myxococcota bacterium]
MTGQTLTYTRGAGLRWSLFSIFAVSGFAGLIYEAIWGRYLKLFLGHSAYAQTFVIAIFMGGMALGSWLAARYSHRAKSLLRGYAITEVAIACFAFVFQPLFEILTAWAYDTAIPGLGHPVAVSVFKQCLSMAMILPPAVLMGMTFPLMSGGIIRLYPRISGSSLAMLYFTNSIGAALGVFLTGFVLIGWIGLPGTTLLAGSINLLVGLTVWLLAKKVDEPQPATARTEAIAVSGLHSAASPKLLFWIAGLTGFASFLYEIGWIRMLSMVLGSSSHAFEIMLGTFIAGLALGGLWVKGRIDRLDDPTAFLATMQWVMGALAILTLYLYNQCFDLMAGLMSGLTRTEAGYTLFNIGSHLLAVVIMLPAAFCAGTTLPLITFALLRRGYGEKSIGQVYACNTVGAILGVFTATHLAMPIFGLKGLVIFGALVDIALAIAIFFAIGRRRLMVGALCAGGLLITTTAISVQFDPLRMASGVYRVARIMSTDSYESLYHADGKTSTVDVIRGGDGRLILITNGKPDASVNPKTDGPPTSDEGTQAFLASVPLALHPDAKKAAVIGIGCGMTTSVLLGQPTLEQVDTVEIEPKMVDGAAFFKPMSSPLFDDPRSRIVIDDARTYFSSTGARYDIIVSEPSNPWVSGVSSLFSEEFYQRVSQHLNEDGLLAQWVQLYELTPELIGSVLTAVHKTFPHVALFATDDSNIVIVASRTKPIGPLQQTVFEASSLASRMGRHEVKSPRTFEVYRVGDLQTLGPLFESYDAPSNSDYFPYLDTHATKQRFLRSSAQDLLRLRTTVVPILDILSPTPRFDFGWNTQKLPTHRPSSNALYPPLKSTFGAVAISRLVINENAEGQKWIRPAARKAILDLSKQLFKCTPANDQGLSIRKAVFEIGLATNPYLDAQSASQLWDKIMTGQCVDKLDPISRQWLETMASIGRRDAAAILETAPGLLASAEPKSGVTELVLLEAIMAAYVKQGHGPKALELWQRHADRLGATKSLKLHHRLLLAHARLRTN